MRTRWDAIRQGERLAELERARLSLGEDPLTNAAELLEAQGVRFIELSLSESISGLFLSGSRYGPSIIVNDDHSPRRRRFSCAHEYCHVLVDRDRGGLVSRAENREELPEVRANAFAAAFLMPERGVRAFVRRLGKGEQPVEASAHVTPGDAAKRFSMHAFGAAFVEVAVDPELGETRVRRIVGAYGAGCIVNPKTTRSQCIGGMIGGIDMALMEHSVMDARNGSVLNANLSEYAVPLHADTPPDMDVIFVEEHDPHVNPLGVKGVGEIAMVGVAPAIANAIFHATGKRIRALPITPDRLR